MRSGTPFFLYLIALCSLGLLVHMWWRGGQSSGVNIADELRPIRQELREVRSEIEEINRVSLKQQASLYKIEAMLDMQSGGGQPVASAVAPAVPAASALTTEPGDVPPPPPPIDDRALSAFVQTQTAARQVAAPPAAQANTASTGGSPAPAPARSEQRQTVVFTPTSTGTVVRTGSSAAAVAPPKPVLPRAENGLSLEDLAALVSTVSVQAASTAAAPAPAEPRSSVPAPAPAVRSTVEAADPALPGAAPVAFDMTRVAVEEPTPAPAPVAPAPNAAAPPAVQPVGAPRRVTTVPSLTAEPQPEVPAVRASRVVRDERARAADITSALSLSDRFAPQPSQRPKVTISDVLRAQDNE